MRKMLYMRNKMESFTLIELLVVIGIIAILMSIAIPAYSRFKEQARIMQAKETAKGIELAMRSYLTEYNEWPALVMNPPGSPVSVEGDVVKMLRGETIGSDNPKEIAFMEVDDETVSLNDPWGNPFRVEVDHDFDNTIDFYGTDLHRPVLVWSWYTNNTGTEGSRDESDCVIKSWE